MKKVELKLANIDWEQGLEIDAQTESYVVAKFGKREIETTSQLKNLANELAGYWENLNKWQATGETLESVNIKAFTNDFYKGYAIIFNGYYNVTFYTNEK